MRKWTKKTAFAMAKTYKDYTKFDREMSGCRKYLKRHGFLHEATIHMVKGQKVIWTFETLKEVVNLVDSRTELYKQYRSAYNRAQKDGLLDILFADKEKFLAKNILKFKKPVNQDLSYAKVELGAFYMLESGGKLFLERGNYVAKRENGSFCSFSKENFNN